MPIRLFRMPPQIFRLVLLIFAIVVIYLVARILLTPSSFRDYGFYRGAALAENMAHTPVFAGKKACDECHSDILAKLAKDVHQTLACEGCHGVSRDHVDNPELKLVIPEDDTCIRCHEANPSRPAWFRQIKVKDHYMENHCAECHVPHQPNKVP